jgi:hypothetical protein
MRLCHNAGLDAARCGCKVWPYLRFALVVIKLGPIKDSWQRKQFMGDLKVINLARSSPSPLRFRGNKDRREQSSKDWREQSNKDRRDYR